MGDEDRDVSRLEGMMIPADEALRLSHGIEGLSLCLLNFLEVRAPA